MKLDRNITIPRRGKYALIKLRQLGKVCNGRAKREVFMALDILKKAGLLDYGDTEDSDFFLIRLKDKYAAPSLRAYAAAAVWDDPEYAAEIDRLASAAENHPNRRKPD